MAVVALTPTEVVVGTPSDDLITSGGTAINAANSYTIAQDEDNRYLIIVDAQTDDKDMTITAGDFFASGQGALVQNFGEDEVRYIMVESARHKDNDGNITITFETGFTGFIQVLKLPK